MRSGVKKLRPAEESRSFEKRASLSENPTPTVIMARIEAVMRGEKVFPDFINVESWERRIDGKQGPLVYSCVLGWLCVGRISLGW